MKLFLLTSLLTFSPLTVSMAAEFHDESNEKKTKTNVKHFAAFFDISLGSDSCILPHRHGAERKHICRGFSVETMA